MKCKICSKRFGPYSKTNFMDGGWVCRIHMSEEDETLRKIEKLGKTIGEDLNRSIDAL